MTGVGSSSLSVEFTPQYLQRSTGCQALSKERLGLQESVTLQQSKPFSRSPYRTLEPDCTSAMLERVFKSHLTGHTPDSRIGNLWGGMQAPGNGFSGALVHPRLKEGKESGLWAQASFH